MITNALIGESISLLLMGVAVTLLAALVSESRERSRLLAGIILAVLGVICLEIFLLQC